MVRRMRSAAVVGCVLATALATACGRMRQAPADDPVERREAAYRANNRGVGLLEQFAPERAAAAFQEALKIDPAVRLARVNLALALFYAGRPEEAAIQARAAQVDYPDAPEPAYLLGLIARAQGASAEAFRQFERVLRIDASDPGARVHLALTLLDERRYAEAAAMAESALAIEPYNATAAYSVGLALTRMGDQARGAGALQRFDQLRTAPFAVTYSQTYLEQGRYAEALPSSGTEPGLVSTEMPAVTFVDATEEWAGSAASDAGSRAVALADIDGDGDLDVLAGGTSLRILRNERPRATDAGDALLASAVRDVGGIAAGDLDNDGRTDLLVLTGGAPVLLMREADGRFAPPLAPMRGRRGPFQSAALVDVDHDGDLDVIAGGASSVLLRNNGNRRFTEITMDARLQEARGVLAIAPIDFDNRRDVDLVMLARATPLMVFRNLRTGAFENVGASVGAPGAAEYTSLAVGDVNKDGFTDLLLGRADRPAVWAWSERAGRYRTMDAPPATRGASAAQLFDYDNDGLLDMFVVADGPRILRNVGATMEEHAAAFAAVRASLAGRTSVAGIAAGDLDGDGDTDVVAAVPGAGLRVWRNDGGSARRAIQVRLTGRASNRAGVGAKVEVRAGSLYQRLEATAAAPAVTPADLSVGLGTRSIADVIRVLWPSGILQTELSPSIAATGAARVALTELDRKPSSCPFLFTWDGERFEFVTDFMGGGEMGYLHAPPDLWNAPDPDEYVRITDAQLRERDGRFELRVTNELEEVLFLDHLALLAVTHPAAAEVFPDEALRAASRPFRAYTVRAARPPRAAFDDHGHDVLARVARRDHQFVDDFERLEVRGYAREHALVVDLGGAPSPGADERVVLLLTGWTDYAFSSDNVRAHQAGLALVPPQLEVETSLGSWRTVDADVGIPVGRPQTLVLDVTAQAPRRVRLRTSMRVYWDEVLVGAATTAPAAVPVPLRRADLRWRGFSREILVTGHALSYEYDAVSRLNPWKSIRGRYTREGDVRELLASADDRFVIARPGDEVALAFEASALPPLRPGMRRTFLLYTSGFSKEMDLHSATPDALEPIPFRAMSRYPYPPHERYPHAADFGTFHTRTVARTVPLLLPEGLP